MRLTEPQEEYVFLCPKCDYRTVTTTAPMSSWPTCQRVGCDRYGMALYLESPNK